MRNIFIVNSTFRKGGNSEALALEFERGAKEAGNAVQTVNLRDLDLKFCLGCLSCLKTGKCVHNDGVNALLPAVKVADILVLASPVYYYSIAGQLKTFLDRLNPLFGQELALKEVYLLLTSADEEKTAMDGAIKAVEGWIECFEGVRLAGVIYGTGADAKGTVQNTPAFEEAYALGKSLS